MNPKLSSTFYRIVVDKSKKVKYNISAFLRRVRFALYVGWVEERNPTKHPYTL